MRPPSHLTRLIGPSSSSSQSSSTSYDYGGLEDILKRQDAVSSGRDEKFAALYGGDIAGSVQAGSRIRDLVSAIRQHAPGASERNPIQFAQPLVRPSSESSSQSGDSNAGGYEGTHLTHDIPAGGAPMKPAAGSPVKPAAGSPVKPASQGPKPQSPLLKPAAQPVVSPSSLPPLQKPAVPPKSPQRVNPMAARGGRDPITIPQEEVFGYPGGYVRPANHVLGRLQDFGNYS